MKRLFRRNKKELRTLLSRPDGEIDVTDIPEIVDWSEAVVGKFSRPNSEWERIPLRVARVRRRKR